MQKKKGEVQSDRAMSRYFNLKPSTKLACCEILSDEISKNILKEEVCVLFD